MITYGGRQIPETLPEILEPSHTAFIVHELLHDFVSPGGFFDKTGMRIDISETLPPTVKLLEAARKSGVKVVYVRFTTFADLSNLNDPMLAKTHERLVASPLMSFDPAQDEPAPERRLQEVAQPVVEGSWGWENIEEVAPRENEPIVRKLRVDCFLQTNLDMILRSNGIRSFVIVGVGAERGIVPTVAHGQNLGYYPVVPADCINPTGPSFEATAVRFIGRYATMTTSEEILGIWNG